MPTVLCEPCLVCGESATVELTEDQLQRFDGEGLVQDALPELSMDDRELLITGTHSACFDAVLPDEG